jgi:hypothetical protein
MYKMVKNESIMQRLKKGTTADDFLAKKKLKKRHQNTCIWGAMLWQNGLFYKPK